MIRPFLFTLSCCSLSLFAYAGIKGKVNDAQGKPLAGVAVVLTDSSGKLVLRTAVTDDNGNYELAVSEQGTYRIQTTAAAFAPYTSAPVVYTAELTMPDIRLSEAARQLKEVSVAGQRPLIEMKAGKVIMNVERSISAAGSTVMDMLQRAPGVSIDNQDNISLKGRRGITIMVDGKRMVLQGAELANLLKSMPAAALEQIELMSNPGSQYDAAGTAGIINLKTKKEKRQGYNGTVQLGAGQGVYPKSNGSVNLNYRTPKINAFFNAAGTVRKGFNKLDLDRIFISNADYDGSYKQDNYAVINMQNGSMNAGLDYNLSRKTTVGVSLTGMRTHYTFDGDNRGKLYDSTHRYLSYFLSNNHQDNSSNSIGGNTNIRHSFDSTGREWSFDADYARYNINNNQTQGTDYFFPDGRSEKPRYVLDGAMKGYTQIYALKTDYIHPFSPGARIETGLKTSFVTADNKPDFYDASSGTRIFDSSKSNHFIYKENILAAYTAFNKDWKQWSLQTGLRYEHTLATGEQRNDGRNFKRDYGQLFPNITASYTASAKHAYSLALSRRIDRPNYEQLNPFKNYIDPTSIHQGNPYLSPSFSYTAELSHTFRNRFITSFSFTRTTDVITQVIILDQDKITLVTDRNLANNNVYSLNGSYPFQVTKWWNSVNNISCYYSLYEGNLSNTPLKDGIPTFYASTNNTFILPQNYTFELNSWYSSDQRYGYMYLRPMYAVNVGVQKTFWNKTGTLRLSGTDLFRAQNPTGITEFSNYRESFIVTRDTRTANLTFTYRFGNSKWQRIRRAGGADEERRRAGGGGQSA